MNPSELVTTYIQDVWNQGDLTALTDLTTPDFTYHLGGQPARDRSAMAKFLAGTREAFPDWHVVVESIVSDGHLVAVRWSGTVTHLGPFHGAPATGRRIGVSGINLYRIADGKIAQEWEQMDSLGLLGQLGLLPG